jgi:hypothetical protein
MAREPNPFDPTLERTPLQLSLDSRSLSNLQGSDAADAAFLISLCDAKEIDALVTWAEPGFAPNLPAAVITPESRGHQDSVAVRRLSEPPGGFIGVIPLFGQWERLANQYELRGAKRERLTHYGPILAFHEQSNRHLFVCADRKLLNERGKSPFKNIWKRIYSVRETLAMVGAALRPYGYIYEEVDNGYSRYLTNYTVRDHLATAALPNRIRLARWISSQESSNERVKQMRLLQESLHLRSTEMLRAREGVERECFRLSQDHATADESLYHLRAAIAALAAGCDSLAMLAAIAIELGPELVGDPRRVGFSQQPFRKALKENGGPKMANRASQQVPMFALLKAFRDPIIHQAGPSGSTVHHVGAVNFAESQITSLSQEQVDSINKLGGGPGGAAGWGLREDGYEPSLAPSAFVGQLASRGMALLNDLLGALASDLELGPLSDGAVIQSQTLRRIRLLSGMDPDYVANGSTTATP